MRLFVLLAFSMIYAEAHSGIYWMPKVFVKTKKPTFKYNKEVSTKGYGKSGKGNLMLKNGKVSNIMTTATIQRGWPWVDLSSTENSASVTQNIVVNDVQQGIPWVDVPDVGNSPPGKPLQGSELGIHSSTLAESSAIGPSLVQRGYPFVGVQAVQRGYPFVDVQAVQRGYPNVDVQAVQRGYPFVNAQGVQSGVPFVDVQGIQRGYPYVTVQGVQSGFPFIDTQGIQRRFPYIDLQGVQNGYPFTGAPAVQSGVTDGGNAVGGNIIQGSELITQSSTKVGSKTPGVTDVQRNWPWVDFRRTMNQISVPSNNAFTFPFVGVNNEVNSADVINAEGQQRGYPWVGVANTGNSARALPWPNVRN